jgi:poly-gamma-glutamate synthesis protein (capsule biosynthesis protein)
MPKNKTKLSLIVCLLLFIHFNIATASSITIIAAGDLMLGSWIQDVIENFGYDYPFQHIDTIFNDADVSFANLEAPFGTKGKAFPKTYSFQVQPELINVLTAGKLNLVSIANNHIMDFGVESLTETVNLLKQNNIWFAGAGLNLAQAREPALFQIKDKKIAFIAYSLTFPQEFWATDTSAGTCFPSHTFVYEDIKKFKNENDLVIVSCHWGEELRETPKDYQIELAHNLIDAGADIILGHHPHVIQGIEFYKDKLIAYSLGNFIFGSYSKKASESYILRLQWDDTGLQTCKIIPINVFNEEVEFQPTPFLGKEKMDFLEKLNKLSLELNSYPIVISSDGNVTKKNVIN